MASKLLSRSSTPSIVQPTVQRAFTLIELLVVIGIITILVGLLVPLLAKTMRQGVQRRIGADLNAIATALEAYKADFGDYPRITYIGASTLNGAGSGADLLGKALLGLGGTANPAAAWVSSTTYTQGQIVSYTNYEYAAKTTCTAQTPGAGSAFWQVLLIPSADGADGLGERIRTGGYGDVHGPYLQADKFKTRGLSLLDYVGNPILYFPGNPARPNVTVAGGSGSFSSTNGNTYVSAPLLVNIGQAPIGTVPAPSLSMYNYSDNDTASVNAALNDSNIPATFPNKVVGAGLMVMEAMLGNYSLSGYINGAKGEVAVTTAPYLLWSAGPDGIFGPVSATQYEASFIDTINTPDSQRKNLVQKCDDVTSFNVGQ